MFTLRGPEPIGMTIPPTAEGNMSQRIALSEMIQDLRSELETAMLDGRDSSIGFLVGSLEVEFELTAEKSAESGGKVRFWVLEADAAGRLAQGTTQKVRLTLEPRLLTSPNQRLLIAGEDDGSER